MLQPKIPPEPRSQYVTSGWDPIVSFRVESKFIFFVIQEHITFCKVSDCFQNMNCYVYESLESSLLSAVKISMFLAQ